MVVLRKKSALPSWSHDRVTSATSSYSRTGRSAGRSTRQRCVKPTTTRSEGEGRTDACRPPCLPQRPSTLSPAGRVPREGALGLRKRDDLAGERLVRHVDAHELLTRSIDVHARLDGHRRRRVRARGGARARAPARRRERTRARHGRCTRDGRRRARLALHGGARVQVGVQARAARERGRAGGRGRRRARLARRKAWSAVEGGHRLLDGRGRGRGDGRWAERRLGRCAEGDRRAQGQVAPCRAERGCARRDGQAVRLARPRPRPRARLGLGRRQGER